MKIAIYNGFTFHYEMFGYLLHYCKTMKYDVTIYCHPQDSKWIAFYYTMYSFQCKDISSFHSDYDYIFLVTDDDPHYHGDVQKTICIDHFHKIRSPHYTKRITTRPFDERSHALPVFPIFHDKKTKHTVSILIIGYSDHYNIPIINRLQSSKEITIHVISRNVNLDSFQGCKFPVIGHSNISTFDIMDIIYKTDYILTDVALPKNYTHENMSGSIPLAMSTLTPLILSKETNAYYQFKNCIEFEENIVLRDINTDDLRTERNEIIERNHNVLNTILS